MPSRRFRPVRSPATSLVIIVSCALACAPDALEGRMLTADTDAVRVSCAVTPSPVLVGTRYSVVAEGLTPGSATQFAVRDPAGEHVVTVTTSSDGVASVEMVAQRVGMGEAEVRTEHNKHGFRARAACQFEIVESVACGDGRCDPAEDCASCAADCGVCEPPTPWCGDGSCDAEEQCDSCEVDCGPCDVPDPSTLTTIEVTLGDGGDDAEEHVDGTIDLYSSDLELMHDARFADDQARAAMRFVVPIPPGATIHTASIQFTVDEVSTGLADLVIAGEAADHAAPFSTQAGDLSRRPSTDARVAWSPAEWAAVGTAGPEQQTPDLSGIVQEVITGSGWARNNAMVVMIWGSGRRVAESFDGVSSSAPTLTITYSGGDTLCGDGICDPDEDTDSCADDCGSSGGELEEPVLPDPRVGGTATLLVEDGTTNHVFEPGRLFSVDVTVTGITSDVVVQWHRPGGGPIADAVIFTPPASVQIQSPSTEVGAYELKVWSPDSLVQFPPQNPGFHRWFGFAILPPRSVSERRVEPDSFFGIIHADDDDPYLRGGIKTVWTKQSPSDVVNKVRTRRSKGLEELPAIASDQLSWDHATPVTAARLEQFRDLIRPFMDELQRQGVASPDWQLGVEIDNALDNGPYGIDNYCQFARILREELDRIGEYSAKIVSSFDGFNYSDDFGALILNANSHYFDAIGTDPYAWWAPDRDFTMPDEASKYLDAPWLQQHIATLRDFMNTNSNGPQEIWFTEMGLPHGGNYDPDDFFGYPSSGVETARRDRLYTANYMLRSHVLAMATGSVSRIYWYNYRDRGGDIDYAEHHFGMRAQPESGADEGFPKPMYAAYAIMTDTLSNVEFLAERAVGRAGKLFAFRTADASELWVVWRSESGSETLALDAMGAVSGRPVAAWSLFGTHEDVTGGSLTISDVPMYIHLQLQ